ncbi:MAG TPA: 50S ribosomal protein L2 [Gammaproteobacteria bacterium]|nr:50S ribosomal protein L2 [Gammaproteobacteria bacterium]
MPRVVIRKHKPTSPGTRHKVSVHYSDIYTGKPEKSLTKGKKRGSGRGAGGRISVRHQGGAAHNKKIRLVDFKRNKDDIPAKVIRKEYDPGRSASILLLCYHDGHKSYVVAPEGVSAGDVLMSGPSSELKPGNTLPMENIPDGTIIHCIELKPGKGAQLIRSAGSRATLAGREGAYAIVRLRTGEVRRIPLACRATVGVVSNSEHSLESLGKAGAKRWKGVRPTVRGVAMNPVDHPHGGGEGRTSGGRHPCSPWAQKTKGLKTRAKKAASNKFIVRSRKKRK